MFKPGDRIRIKSWDKMVEEYGLNVEYSFESINTGEYNFPKDMNYLCEEEGHIIEFNIDENCIEIELDKYGEITDWYITEEMIELI